MENISCNSKLNKSINYYGSERKDVFSIFPDGVDSVLDVGAGSGNVGARLKEKGINRVVGIEVSREAAELAKSKIDEVIVGDVENYPFNFNEKFDTILFLDVLEHLKDPWSVLVKMNKYLKDGGAYILSVPNIRYYRVLLNIIFKGEFKYEEQGILDIGHLRFFTYKMLKQYLDQAGFKIVRVKRNFSGHISWLANTISLNIFADFFTRQYIVLAIEKVVNENVLKEGKKEKYSER